MIEMYVKTSESAWGVVIKIAEGEEPKHLNGRYVGTPLAASIYAVAQGLQSLPDPSIVTVYSDIDYLINGAAHYRKKWIRHGWLKDNGQPPEHLQEWQALTTAEQRHQVSYDFCSKNHPLLNWAAGVAKQVRWM